MKPKICKSCRQKFQPTRPMQKVCSFGCAVQFANTVSERNAEKKRKADEKAHREAKVKAKTRAQWLKEAQVAFNRWIRIRDSGRPCISCGRIHQGQNHAGHYLSIGARPELRFNEQNVHLQCQPCNTHLSGNLVNYRIGLLTKIGAEQVQFLEGPHEPCHYTIDEIKEIKARYTALCKEIK